MCKVCAKRSTTLLKTLASCFDIFNTIFLNINYAFQLLYNRIPKSTDVCVCGCVRARARVSLCLQKIVPLGFDLFVTR